MFYFLLNSDYKYALLHMTTAKSIKMVNILCLRPYTICVLHSQNGKLRSENDFISMPLNNDNSR